MIRWLYTDNLQAAAHDILFHVDLLRAAVRFDLPTLKARCGVEGIKMASLASHPFTASPLQLRVCIDERPHHCELRASHDCGA